MTTRPTHDSTPEDASLAAWMVDVEKFIDELIGNERIPSTPKELTLTANKNSVRISFRAVNEVGVSEYQIFRGSNQNFSSDQAELIATIPQAVTPATTTIIWSDPEAVDKKFYFVRAVKGLRRPKIVGSVVGHGTSFSSKKIKSGSAAEILGIEGAPGGVLFIDDDANVAVDLENFLWDQEKSRLEVSGWMKVGNIATGNSVAGHFRYNSANNHFEGYDGSQFTPFDVWEDDGTFVSLKTNTRQLVLGADTGLDYVQHYITGAFTSLGASTIARLVEFDGTLTGADEDTTSLYGVNFNQTIITQTATESIVDVAAVNFEEPKITDNLTGNISTASTVRIAGAPDEGVLNWALNVVSGNTFFGGDVQAAGDLLLSAADLGDDVPGRIATFERNTNLAVGTVGPAPGILELEAADSVPGFLWVDDDGDLRIHTAAATGNVPAATVDANDDGFKILPVREEDWSFVSPTGSSGTFFLAGFYNAPAADSNLTQASATQTLGTANAPYGAHAFVVAAAAGGASGGAGLVEIEVSGTSMGNDGTRTASDTEVIVADITAMATDQYFETVKKWIGQVTYTLQVAGGGTHTTFNADFNYGFAKYETFESHDFKIFAIEVEGRAGANDTGFNMELIHHTSAGWTYSAAAFVPGPPPDLDFAAIHSTESDLANGEEFAWRRDGLAIEVAAASEQEGFLWRCTTTANKAIETMNVLMEVNPH